MLVSRSPVPKHKRGKDLFHDCLGEGRGTLQVHLWSNKPRILVADRSEQIIQAVAKILAKEFEVVGFARDGEETLRAVIHLKPDIAVMDIIMPMMDGIRVARRLKEINSPTKTVFLSGLEDQEYVEACLAAGAHGFVFKKRVVRDLSLGIREVLAGRIFVSSRSRS